MAYALTCQEWTRLSLFTVCWLSPISVLRHRPDDLYFSEEDSDLVCQPGAGWMEINETLKEKGIPLFFPVRVKCRTRVTPSSSSTYIHSSIQDPQRPLAGCSAQAALEVSTVKVLFTVTDAFSRQLTPSAMARRRANGS